jgi:hypothetical protein
MRWMLGTRRMGVRLRHKVDLLQFTREDLAQA